jgi:phosphate-selective porin OprO and OprP
LKIQNKILVGAVALATASISANVYADSTQDLIDALITKGVLTEDEGALLAKGRKAEKKSVGSVSKKLELVSPDGKSSVKLSGRVQADYRHFEASPDSKDEEDEFSMRRVYLGASGKWNEYIGYKANLELSSGNMKLGEGYVNLEYFKPAQFLFGQFKTSMSLEERTSSRFTNFTERSYVNNAALTEGKDTGVMLHGTPTKGFNYSLAAVNGYGMNNGLTDNNDDSLAYIGHVDVDLATMNKWKGKIFHVGASIKKHELDVSNYVDTSSTEVGLVGISQSTIGKGRSFFSATRNTGVTETDLSSYGLELALANGPFKVQAEYANANFDSNLDDQDIKAYYLEAGWLVTGENYADSYKSKSMGGKFDRIKPNSNFNPENGKGIGAWEVMLGISKFDATDFNQNSAGYTAAASQANEATSWRTGLKWILDPNTRMMLSYVDTDFDVSGNTSTYTGINDEQAINFRAQFDF